MGGEGDLRVQGLLTASLGRPNAIGSATDLGRALMLGLGPFLDPAQHSSHHRVVAELHQQHRDERSGAPPIVEGVQSADQPGPPTGQRNQPPGPAAGPAPPQQPSRLGEAVNDERRPLRRFRAVRQPLTDLEVLQFGNDPPSAGPGDVV